MGLDMGLVKKILCVLAACVEIICGASCFYTYDQIRWSDDGLSRGYSPDGEKDGHKWYGSFVNETYFVKFSLFMFGLIALIMAVIEIMLLIDCVAKYVEFAASMVLRAIIYVLTGIAILGTANDLGIAAGSMSIIVGGIMLILSIFEMIKH